MENKPLRIKDRVEYLDGFAYIDEDIQSTKRLLKKEIKKYIAFNKRYNYDVILGAINDIIDACIQIEDDEAAKGGVNTELPACKRESRDNSLQTTGKAKASSPRKSLRYCDRCHLEVKSPRTSVYINKGYKKFCGACFIAWQGVR